MCLSGYHFLFILLHDALSSAHTCNQLLCSFDPLNNECCNSLIGSGKSRYPGLFVWLREGRKIPVKVPDGCLLVQAGQQMEYLTGGAVSAGMHEVVVTEATMDAVDKNAAMHRPPWRVSSTLFGHIASDVVLEPLDVFKNSVSAVEYPAIRAGDQVLAVLDSVALGNQEQEHR